MTKINSIKLIWIQNLRWIAIAFQFVLIYPAIKFGYLALEQLPLYLITVVALMIFNVAIFWNKIIPIYNKISVQLSIDLIVFTIFILLTGKMENPFWPMLYFHAALAAVLLPPKEDRFFLPVLFGSIALVQYLSVEHYTSFTLILIPQWIVLIAIWFLSRQTSLILEKQRAQINTLNAKELKNQKLKSIASLSSGILHEIGTPLNTIRLKTDRLINKGIESFTHTDIETVDLSLKNIESVVDQLNKAQHESLQEITQNVSLKSYLKGLKTRWEKEYPLIKITIHCTSEQFVSLAKVNFNMVMKIILDNSVEAGSKNIEFFAQEEEEALYLSIQDDGPGFDDFILDNFGAPYTSTKGKGHGIGLYSAGLSLESMGGQLTIANTQKGAKICITLEKAHEK